MLFTMKRRRRRKLNQTSRLSPNRSHSTQRCVSLVRITSSPTAVTHPPSPPAYIWLLTKSPEALLFSRATLCSGEISFLPDRCSKICLLKPCTLTGCLPCSPSSNATNRSRPCIFHPLQSAGLSVSMLTSSIPELLSPLGSGSSTWVQPLTVGLWNLPCACFSLLVNICISL